METVLLRTINTEDTTIFIALIFNSLGCKESVSLKNRRLWTIYKERRSNQRPCVGACLQNSRRKCVQNILLGSLLINFHLTTFMNETANYLKTFVSSSKCIVKYTIETCSSRLKYSILETPTS